MELLSRPCRARQILAGRVIRDRRDGRERLVLANMNENSGAELLWVDYENDTAEVIRAPAGAGSWALLEVEGDRLVVGTFYDGQFMVFDLRTMEWITTVSVPGESYIWNLALGNDGRVYGGTYGGGKLAALNLDTYEVVDCGAPAPPNLYLRHVSATPDGRILCSFGTERPTTRLFHPQAKRFDAVPTSLTGVSLGVAWNGFFLAGGTVYDGHTLDAVAPPFPVPDGAWSVDTSLTTPDAVYIRQGSAVYRSRIGSDSPELVFNLDLRGGWCLASASDGSALGVRGQDYFHLRRGDESLNLRRIPGESGPRATLFLRADADGRLWGGPTFGQTLFHLDPRTREAVNTGAVCDSGGEVYDVAFDDGRVYAASYSGGDIVEYDSSSGWDQWNHRNPRPLANVGSRGYIRPTGGIVATGDGRLVSGWMAQYGRYGGAVAVTDTTTGETRLWENPLGEQAIEGVAVVGDVAYLGTSLSANGLPSKKGESPRFGSFNLRSGEATVLREYPDRSSARSCAFDAKTHRVVFVVDGAFSVFDTATARFADDEFVHAPRVRSRNVVVADGVAFYGSGSDLVSVSLTDGSTRVVDVAPEAITNVAAMDARRLFVAAGTGVYAVTPTA
jgi:outer membrane protein assembly factor BamB